MADEIFVGSVSVGVVPDLRGFNDRLRAELVPTANNIGREMGREMARGIMDDLNIGKIITESTAKAQVVARREGYSLGLSYGRAMRRGIELALDRIRVNVEVGADTALARAEIARLGGTVTERIRTTGGGGGLAGLIPGGSARGAGGAAGGAGFIGGISALLKALPGGTSGSVAAVPAAVGVPAALITAGLLPFLGQAIGGFAPLLLGGGLAGIGALGAFGLKGQATASGKELVYQANLSKATERVGAAQARLNQLQGSGKATAAQLASAEASLANARTSQTLAQQKLNDAEKHGLIGRQETVRQAFEGLGVDATKSLAKIGQSFVPVMMSIVGAARSTMNILTPVFATAVKTISGPFKIFADTIIRSFGSPQVKSSIQAVAVAFGDILTAFGPDIPGIINSFADAIERIAQSVSKNPKAFADFLNFIFQVGIAVLNAIAFLTDFANYVEQHFMPAMHDIAHTFDTVRHDIAHTWDLIVRHIEGAMHEIAVIFDGARHEIAHVWDDIYHNTIGQVIRLVTGIKNYMVENYDKWWAANGEAIKRIWRALWTQMVVIFKLFFGPIVAAAVGIWRLIQNAFKGSGDRVASYWSGLWHNVVNIFKSVFGPVVTILRGFWTAIVNQFRISASVIEAIWKAFWNTLRNVAMIFINYMKTTLKIFWDVLVGIFTIGINLLTGRWRAAWNALLNMVHQVWNAMSSYWRDTLNRIGSIFSGWFNAFRALVIGAFRSAINWLVNAGGAIVQGLMQGMENAVRGIGGWIKGHIVDPIIKAVKSFFGIHSPAAIMLPLGVSITSGLIHGVLSGAKNLGGLIGKIFGGWPEALAALAEKSLISLVNLPAKAIKALGGLAGRVGGAIGGFFSHLVGGGGAGVSRWAPLVMQALSMLGLSGALAPRVLYQMQTESGGNPNAINLTDINAQRGDPSRGLLQTIGSTFAAYHVPGTSMNIYDPLANIAAAINYALHTYGPTLMRGGMGMGSGRGYALGGPIDEPIHGYGLWTGSPYSFAERGREWVVPDGSMATRGGDGGNTYVAHFDSLTGAAIESHVRTAYQAMSITQSNLSRPGRRRLCQLQL